jgi:hypothetical protein
MATDGERPGVTVEQEFITPAPALEDPELPVVIIGPARQLEVDLEAGTYDGSLQTGIPYPDLALNGQVDTATVVVKIQNSDGTFTLTSGVTANVTDFDLAASISLTRDILAGATTGSIAGGAVPTNTLEDLNQSFITSGVQIGDVIVWTSGSLVGDNRNVTAVNGTTLVFDGAAVAVDESNIGYTIQRTEAMVGTILVTYEADRQDFNDILVTITDDDSVEELVGPVDPRNPLGFAVSKARLNASDRTILATGVSAQTVEEYTRALEFLESKEVYHLVLLTQDPAILGLAEPHVDAASLPENKHERVAWLNRELVLQETKISVSQNRAGSFNDSNQQFTDDGTGGAFFDFNNFVAPGDILVWTDGVNTYQLLIQQILDPVTLLINQPGSPAYPPGALAANSYTVLSAPKTKTEQAQFLADYASSFGNRRIIFAWPDVVEVSFGGALQPVEGYYLAAATAGLKSGQKPQQPLTNLSVAGFTRLFNSNTYFNESQLKILDAGGVMVHEQPVVDGPIVVRRQRTTDTSDLKKTELSIVTIVDFVAKFLRQELSPYIGKYNITPEYLEMLKVVINGLTARLKENTEVGPVILEGTLVSIEQDEVELDTVDIVYQIEAPYPANFLRVKLQV